MRSPADRSFARFHCLVLTKVVALSLLCTHAAAADMPVAVGDVVNDPVAQLQRRLDRGDAHLHFESDHGFLASVLRELAIPTQSQALVFSKTSLQASLISPRNPRAIYFNDDVYVGWVRGAPMLEIASVDAKRGPVFYQLRQREAERPLFMRETESCVQCHQPGQSEVPTLLMRSVFPDPDGMPVFQAGTFHTTDQSPFKERWGGWYVDGQIKNVLGMGNGLSDDPAHPEQLTRTDSNLTKVFDSSSYLSSHSDVVALLLLAHQTNVHNLMTRAADGTHRALQQQAAIEQMEGEAHHGALSDTTRRWIESACEPLVQALLFTGENFSAPVAGSTDFAGLFQARGSRDSQGRSLRDFDLHHRLFRYPCSYLIYSDQFDALPDPARQQVYHRLWQILTGRDDSRAFAHLSDADRDAIYEILRQSKPGLPGYWKKRG